MLALPTIQEYNRYPMRVEFARVTGKEWRMAGKKGMRWARGLASPTRNEEVRKLINESEIIKALRDHVLGSKKMTDPSQVTAAVALLRKVLPDLATTELVGDPDRPLAIAARDEILGKLLPDAPEGLRPEETGKPLAH